MLQPVLSAFWDEKDSFTIEGYKRHGGYDAAKKRFQWMPMQLFNWLKIPVYVVAVVLAFQPE